MVLYEIHSNKNISEIGVTRQKYLNTKQSPHKHTVGYKQQTNLFSEVCLLPVYLRFVLDTYSLLMLCIISQMFGKYIFQLKDAAQKRGAPHRLDK